MPSKTASGLPYPLPTEPVRDGAANIQALATALDVRIQSGSAIVSTTASSSDGYIPFPTAFRAGTVPIVVVSVQDPVNITVIAFSYFQYTDATRAAVRLMNSATGGLVGAGAYRIGWVAVGLAP